MFSVDTFCYMMRFCENIKHWTNLPRIILVVRACPGLVYIFGSQLILNVSCVGPKFCRAEKWGAEKCRAEMCLWPKFAGLKCAFGRNVRGRNVSLAEICGPKCSGLKCLEPKCDMGRNVSQPFSAGYLNSTTDVVMPLNL